MARRSIKVWRGTGVGGIAVVASGLVATGPALAQHAGHQSGPNGAKSTQAASQQGQVMAPPQGGEAYLTDGGPKDTRIRVYRDIALMRGHLLVGAELIEQGLWDEALPHFLHPTEELYGLMERYIVLHKVTPFRRQLAALAQAVKARNKPAYLQASKVVEARIAGALRSFKKFMTGKPFTSYTARTLVEMVKVTQSEYEAAIEGGRFGKPVEYQDSRGFLWHAQQLLALHRRDFERVDKARFGELMTILAELKKAWPAPMPPAAPVVAPADLANNVERFGKAAERFF